MPCLNLTRLRRGLCTAGVSPAEAKEAAETAAVRSKYKFLYNETYPGFAGGLRKLPMFTGLPHYYKFLCSQAKIGVFFCDL